MSGKSYLPVLGDRGCPARHRLILPLRCPRGGLAPASPARWALAPPGGGLNPSGTGSTCPGGEDHLKRRSSSPPVPPLLGCRHRSPVLRPNRHAPRRAQRRQGQPATNRARPLPGTAEEGSVSAASGSVQGRRGRSPRRNKLLVTPFPSGEGGGGIGGRKAS